jgi:glutamate:GABA antiporter
MSDSARPKLSSLDTTLYAIVSNVGLRWIAVAAAVGAAALPLWLAAMVVFFIPLAVATAELTERFPGEGGIYAWTRDSFGPFAGFLCGWFYWAQTMPYFAGILYFLSNLLASAAGLDTKSPATMIAISSAISAVIVGFQLAGFSWGKWLTNVGAAGTWTIFLALAGTALFLGLHGQQATHFLSASYAPRMNFDTAILWGTMVFAFCGAEAVGFLRNEVEGGMATIRRALAILGPSMAIAYIVGTVIMLVILPQPDLTRLAGFADVLKAGALRIGFATLGPVLIALFAVTQLGGFAAWFSIAARLPFVAGMDDFLPKAFAYRNPKTGAPTTAIWLQAATMMALVVLSQLGSSVAGAYDFLVSMTVITATLPYLFQFAVYIKAARNPRPDAEWRPPGGARTSLFLGAMGLAATLAAIACTLVPSSADSHPLASFLKIVLSTSTMVVVGLAFYRLAARKRRTVMA